MFEKESSELSINKNNNNKIITSLNEKIDFLTDELNKIRRK